MYSGFVKSVSDPFPGIKCTPSKTDERIVGDKRKKKEEKSNKKNIHNMSKKSTVLGNTSLQQLLFKLC